MSDFPPAISHRHASESVEGIKAWSAILEELYGPVRIETPGSRTLEGRIASADLWQVRLRRIEMSRHRISLTPSLARPGTHLLNQIRFQTQGRVIFEQDGQSIAIEPGDCFVHNLSRPYTIRATERTAHDAVILPIELVKLQSVPVELLWSRRIAAADRDDTGNLAHNIVKTILEAPPALSQSSAASIAQALLHLLNAFFSRDIVGSEGFTRSAMTRWRAKAYIEDHLRDPDLDVARVAAALGCTPRYLHTIFRDDELSIGRFMWRTRLQRCRDELESPANANRSITDIAFSWGFSSASHFSRLFRARFGVRPSDIVAGRR